MKILALSSLAAALVLSAPALAAAGDRYDDNRQDARYDDRYDDRYDTRDDDRYENRYDDRYIYGHFDTARVVHV
ncbi:MAG: hypothetical protein RLZZ537_1639 [Pseudomonadota bacterium]|jgi:hypothetical protein